MPKIASWPSSSVSVAPLRSRLPVSTPTTRCTGCVCSRTARLPARQERVDYVNGQPPSAHAGLKIHSAASPGEVNESNGLRPGRLDGLTFHAAPLAFRHAAPDTEALVVLQVKRKR